MDKDNSADRTISFLPSGDTCVKCGTTGNLQKYDGDLYCNGCLNEWLAMQ